MIIRILTVSLLCFASFAFADIGPNDLYCLLGEDTAELKIVASQKLVATYESFNECESAREAVNGGVVCAYFTADMPLPQNGWQENGWRAMTIETKKGLGRKVHSSFDTCLLATKNASGGVVCIDTGVGYKSANIQTNNWCGASSALQYCVKATNAARKNHVCTFPSDGSGAEAGWVVTKVTSGCEYLTSKATLEKCNSQIP